MPSLSLLLLQRAAAARRTASARRPWRAEITFRRNRADHIWRDRWWYGSIRTADRFRRTRSVRCRRTRTRTSWNIPVYRRSRRSKPRAAACSTGKARTSRRWWREECPSTTRAIGDWKWCVFAAIRCPTKGRCSEARWTNAEYVTTEARSLSVSSTWYSSRGVARPATAPRDNEIFRKIIRREILRGDRRQRSCLRSQMIYGKHAGKVGDTSGTNRGRGRWSNNNQL